MITKRDFVDWMRRKGLSAATIKKYSEDTPNNLEVQTVLARLTGHANMYNCTSTEIQHAVSIVMDMDFDIIGHKMYSAGLKKFLIFLQELSM